MLDGGAVALWEQTKLTQVSYLSIFPRKVEKLNCCLSRKSLLHKGPIILVLLGRLARFRRLAACAPVT